MVDWIAYGHVVQTSKDRSLFGKGDIRGVIAPESTTSAKEGGGLVPTLLFGIPGSGSMAIFLAGMVLIGLQPGPSMVGQNLGMTYTVVWSLAIANVIGTLLCIALAPGVARITHVRYALVAPFMILVISFAAFQPGRSFYDLLALLLIGTLGIFLRRFGWPRPAFLIGFVLATQGERYLYQAVQFSGWNFFMRPIVLVIAGLILLSVFVGARSGGQVHTEGRSGSSEATPLWPQIVFALVLVGLFLFAAYESLQLSFLAKVYPAGIAVVGLVASAAVLWPLLSGKRSSAAVFDSEAGRPKDEDGPLSPMRYLAWLAGFVGLIGLVGYFLGLFVFFIAFMRRIAKASWPLTIVLTAVAATIILTLGSVLNMHMPTGLLQEFFHDDLPWPLA